MPMSRTPGPIRVLFLIDVLLVGLYVVVGVLYELTDWEFGALQGKIKSLVDIETEGNFATWFATVQLFLLAVMLALHAWRHTRAGASPVVWIPAAVALLLSIDEIAMLHEWAGYQLDVLMPDGTRRGTALHYTGLWGIIIGVPALALICIMWWKLRAFLSDSPRAVRLLMAGSVTLIVGAAGFDVAANFTVGNQWLHGLEVVLEEGCELIGATLMCWGAYELLCAGGFRLEYRPSHALPPGSQIPNGETPRAA